MPHPRRLVITSRSADVHLAATSRTRLTVEGGDVEEDADGTVHINRQPKVKLIEVRCPAGSDVKVATSSGDVVLEGQLGSVMVSTLSGSAKMAATGDLEVRTASGNVDIESCQGSCRTRTASGKIVIGRAHELDLSTVSGRVEVHRAQRATIRGVSAKIVVGAVTGADLQVQTFSGSVEVTVPGDCRPETKLSSVTGKVRREHTEGDDALIVVQTTTGKIRVSER